MTGIVAGTAEEGEIMSTTTKTFTATAVTTTREAEEVRRDKLLDRVAGRLARQGATRVRLRIQARAVGEAL
jgi:hypothetical protein